MLAVERLQRRLRVIRMQLDLVEVRHDLGRVHELLEPTHGEVAHADRAHPVVREQPLERAVGVDRAVEEVRCDLMQDEHVDLLEAELRRRLLEGVEGPVVAVVGRPHLRLDHDVVAVDARGSQTLAHLALVAVRRGRVDVAVAGSDGRLDGSGRLVGRGLEDAEADRRQCDAIAEMHGGFHAIDAPSRRTREGGCIGTRLDGNRVAT